MAEKHNNLVGTYKIETDPIDNKSKATFIEYKEFPDETVAELKTRARDTREALLYIATAKFLRLARTTNEEELWVNVVEVESIVLPQTPIKPQQ